MSCFAKSPAPSCPCSPLPLHSAAGGISARPAWRTRTAAYQANTSPVLVFTSVCVAPQRTSVARKRSGNKYRLTGRGKGEPGPTPMPNCPRALHPHASTCPAAVTATVCRLPAATRRTERGVSVAHQPSAALRGRHSYHSAREAHERALAPAATPSQVRTARCCCHRSTTPCRRAPAAPCDTCRSWQRQTAQTAQSVNGHNHKQQWSHSRLHILCVRTLRTFPSPACVLAPAAAASPSVGISFMRRGS